MRDAIVENHLVALNAVAVEELRERGHRADIESTAAASVDTIDGMIRAVVWEVWYLEDAARERLEMSAAERVALDRAVDKLAAFGPQLPFPHQSSVRRRRP